MTFKRDEEITVILGHGLSDPKGRGRFYQDGDASKGLAVGSSGIDLHIRLEGPAANKIVQYLKDKELLALSLITVPSPPEPTVQNPETPHAP
jgi:hypothetical protein